MGRQPSPTPACGHRRLWVKRTAAPEAYMSAIYMIIVFIAFIGLMNRLDFGRVD
jgi:hypothetical protein